MRGSRTVTTLPWQEITYVVARINDDCWLEGSGSLKPEDGLSAACRVSGTDYVAREAPASLLGIVALLAAFVRKDGRWRTMIEWS